MKHRLSLFLAFLVLTPRSLWACAACYGQSDSPMAAGMNWGIFTLLGTVMLVLIGFGAFFIFLAKRSAAAAALDPLEAPPSAIMPQPLSLKSKILAPQPVKSAFTLSSPALGRRAPRLVVRRPRPPGWRTRLFSLRRRKVRSRLSWSPPSRSSN